MQVNDLQVGKIPATLVHPTVAGFLKQVKDHTEIATPHDLEGLQIFQGHRFESQGYSIAAWGSGKGAIMSGLQMLYTWVLLS